MTSASFTQSARSAAVPSTAPKYTQPCSLIASSTVSERDTFADHAPQTAFHEHRRVRVHPRCRRRSRGPQRVTRTRRGWAREVHDLSFEDRRGAARLPLSPLSSWRGPRRGPCRARRSGARRRLILKGSMLLHRERRFQPDRLGAHSSAEAVRWEWQSRLTATGKAAMWVGKLSMWTASAVCVPP